MKRIAVAARIFIQVLAVKLLGPLLLSQVVDLKFLLQWKGGVLVLLGIMGASACAAFVVTHKVEGILLLDVMMLTIVLICVPAFFLKTHVHWVQTAILVSSTISSAVATVCFVRRFPTFRPRFL